MKITTIKQAIKFVEEKENLNLEEVKIKWIATTQDLQETFKFSDDNDLINWCESQRQQYFNEEDKKKV